MRVCRCFSCFSVSVFFTHTSASFQTNLSQMNKLNVKFKFLYEIINFFNKVLCVLTIIDALLLSHVWIFKTNNKNFYFLHYFIVWVCARLIGGELLPTFAREKKCEDGPASCVTTQLRWSFPLHTSPRLFRYNISSSSSREKAQQPPLPASTTQINWQPFRRRLFVFVKVGYNFVLNKNTRTLIDSYLHLSGD